MILAVASTYSVDPFRSKDNETRQLLESREYRTITEATKFRDQLTANIDEFIRANMPETFDVAYWRSDMQLYCEEHPPSQCNPTLQEIQRKLELHGMNKEVSLYMSSNNLTAEPRTYFDHPKLFSLVDVQDKLTAMLEPSKLTISKEEEKADPMILLIFDVMMAVRARTYLGNRHSDFSLLIVEQREMLNKKSYFL